MSQTVDQLVLSNGTVITPGDRQFLESLRPDYEKMVSSLVGDAAARSISKGEPVSLTAEIQGTLIESVKQFMKQNIGEGWERYFIEGTFGDPIEIQVGGPELSARWSSVPLATMLPISTT